MQAANRRKSGHPGGCATTGAPFRPASCLSREPTAFREFFRDTVTTSKAGGVPGFHTAKEKETIRRRGVSTERVEMSLDGSLLLPSLPASPSHGALNNLCRCLQHGAHGEMTCQNEKEQEERSSTPAAMSVLGSSGPVNTNDVLKDAG